MVETAVDGPSISSVEALKLASDGLRGLLAADLADLATALGERRRRLHAVGESTEGLDWSAIAGEWRQQRATR